MCFEKSEPIRTRWEKWFQAYLPLPGTRQSQWPGFWSYSSMLRKLYLPRVFDNVEWPESEGNGFIPWFSGACGTIFDWFRWWNSLGKTLGVLVNDELTTVEDGNRKKSSLHQVGPSKCFRRPGERLIQDIGPLAKHSFPGWQPFISFTQNDGKFTVRIHFGVSSIGIWWSTRDGFFLSKIP